MLTELEGLAARHRDDPRFARSIGIVARQLADLEHSRGDLPAAIRMLERAAHTGGRLADPATIIGANQALGALLASAGDTAPARRAFAAAASYAEAWVAGASRDARALQLLVMVRLAAELADCRKLVAELDRRR